MRIQAVARCVEATEEFRRVIGVSIVPCRKRKTLSRKFPEEGECEMNVEMIE